MVCALGAILVACQGQQDVAGTGSVYNDQVAKALQQRRDADTRKRAMLAFDSGATAQTCGEYLRLLANSTLKEDVNNQIAKGEYLLCEVLAMIGDKKLGAGRQDVAFGQALAARLDLRSFPSSLFQTLDEKKHSLSQLDTNAVSVEPTGAAYETNDWRFRLELVATLDVNNNGKPDWVVWLADEAKSGNYRQYQTLIAHDVGDTGSINAVPYAVTMNAKH
jgi:hypothetical protein